jgi:hypothetical protein
MLMDARSPVAKQIATSIEEVFGFRGVALYEGTSGEVCRAGAGQDATLLPLSLSGQAIGSLALPASDVSQTAQRAIAHLAAIAIERARGQEAASRAEAAHQSETL